MIKRYLTILLPLFVLTSMYSQVLNEPVSEKYSILKIFPDSPTQLNEMIMMEIDFDHLHGDMENGIQLYLTHSDIIKLDKLNIKYKIEVEDFHKFYDERQAKALNNLPSNYPQKTAANFGYGSMGGFYTFSEIEAKLDEMSTLFPSICTQKYSIGTSIEGRTIWAVKISDNPNVDEPEDVAYYDALHHAREPLSMAATINYMFWLLENYGTDPAVTYIINNRELYFVPVVNPDGYEYNRATNPNGGGLWRKNRRGGYGVDLNRNYGYQWGFNNSCASSSTSSNTYKGTAPFSEPETAAVRDFVANISPTVAFSTHATAGSYLMPYGYNSTPPEFTTYAEWASDFLSENDYPYGTTSQMLGYTSCGTTRDYLHTTGVYTWTPEIDGSGFWPAQSEIFDLVDENIYPMFYQAWISGGFADVQSHEVIGDAEAGGNFQLKVELKNKGAGSAANNIEVHVVPSNSQVVASSPVNYGSIAARAKKDNASNLFNISIDPNFNQGIIQMDIIVYQDGTESKRETIEVLVGTKAQIFYDGAENGTANWSTSGNGISWGTNYDDSYSGSRSFGDSDGSNTTNSTTNYFTLNAVVALAGKSNPHVEFFSKWSFEPGDYASLQISTNGGSSWTTLESYTGAEAWIQKQINLSAYIGNNVRLRFRLITDNSLNTDGFYFDDFAINDYVCAACPVCNSSISNFPYSESFENDFGAWSQGTADDMDWTRRGGSTPSSATGPSGANDGSVYVYVESSNPNFPNKTANLVSPCFDLSSATAASFDFDYHMYGESMGTLNVDVSINDGATWTQGVWSLSGNQGNLWFTETIDLQNYLGEFVKIRFRGTTANSYRSDFSIDKINLTATTVTCTGQACDDGDACTTGETYDANCNCTGGTFQDADNDGVCDANDVCPNFDDNLIGAACNDNDVCTTGETYDANCGCSGGTFQDSDNDGICDALDDCDGNNPLTTSGTIANPLCNAANGVPDGFIDISVTNGVAPYTYDWSPSGSGVIPTAEDQNNLGQGTYTVVVTDANGCTDETTYTLTEPTPIDISTTVIQPGCGNNTAGEITTQTTGGTAPYTYAWTGPQGSMSSQNITNAVAGTYDLVVTDVNGCTDNINVTLSNNSTGMACDDNDPCTTGETYDANCNCSGGSVQDADNDGVCDANDVCPNFDDNLIGTACNDNDVCTTGETYDANCGCSGGTFQDSDNDGICDALDDCDGNNPLTTSGTIADPLCNVANGVPDGFIDITVTNGVSPYTYDWSPSGTGVIPTAEDQNNLGQGTYTVVVTDANGCTDETTYTLTEPTPLDISTTVIQPECGNNTVGEITTQTTGGTAPYTYSWTGPQGSMTAQNITNAVAGTYDLTVTDVNGCTDIISVTLSNNSVGMTCDDNNPCTTGETYDTNCNCTGGTFQDADNDGVCDADDICPGGDDNADADGDNIPDACDSCGCPSIPATNNTQVTVNNVSELEAALDQAFNSNGDITIIMNPGNYILSSNLRFISANMENLTILGGTGNPDDVVIKGQGWNNNAVTHIFNVAADHFTLAHVTIGEVYYHAIQVHSNPSDADDFLVQNVKFVDVKEQMLKVSAGGTLFSDRGQVLCCQFEFTSGIAFQDYTGGIDAHRAKNWRVANNIFKGIISPNAILAEHAIHFWRESEGTLVESNQIIDCDRGIGFGLNNDPASGHTGGLIINNFVHTSTDVGIGLETAPDAKVYNNTVITDNYNNSIEYRFSSTSNVHIANNLTNKTISDRSSGSSGTLQTNYLNTDLSIFADAAQHDYHLVSNPTQIVDAGTDLNQIAVDYDCDLRNIATTDIGADEYNGPSCTTVGQACDDGNACTSGETFDANCNCTGGTSQDSDNDGVCDANDVCPNFDDNLIGAACNDNDACTTGETYDANCGCSGGTFQDSDNDGICDANDVCPNFDDNLIGSSCNDNDSCTTNDVYTSNCNCAGTAVADSDNDGVCDTNDQCPNFDDNLIGTACNDNDPCTTGETYDSNCGCSGGTFQDSDNDGICDANDSCPNDPTNNCNITPPCTSSGSNTSYEYIQGVTIGSITNASGDDSGYGDFTYLSTTLDVGQTYSVQLTPGFAGTAYNEFWSIFIDLDGNGDFSGANETILTVSSNAAIVTNLSIPAGSPTGTKLMRVAMQYNSAPVSCGTFNYGEVEDYTVVINAGCTVGASCDDGDNCTANDVYDNNCNCVGTAVQDADNDGVCDANDICPNFDDNLIGTPCNDNDSCTTGETYDSNCGCSGGTTADSDNDGVCDGLDQCPGQNDNLIGTACNDNDACTTNDVYTANCNCAGTPTSDADNDGICDANDICPNFDDNLIGTPCNDNDPCTTGETYDTNCGCSGGTTADSDGDGVCDANDICPGSDDNVDTDNNGIPDGCESCSAYNFNANPIIGYDPGQDLGNYNIQDAGATVYIENNSWKALDIDYTVTNNTVIAFDFKSTIQGEIHEVSFDNDLSLAPLHRMVLYGTQGYAGNYNVGTYTNQGQWQSYAIPIGNFFTGNFKYLVLTADDDNGVVGNSWFRNVSIYEDMNGDLACDNACTPGTSCDDGDPCTSGETYDSMCGCTGGTLASDADGDGVCDLADICPGFDDNLIGTACSDNDPCTAGETYDANCGCSGGSYIDNDNDGYCAANDPDDNDSCVPDNSNCSGCQTFDFNDFESNLGLWNDGGSDCFRGTGFAAYSSSGTASVRIRDNSGSASSLYSDVLDMSAYAGVDVSFSFLPNSMETNEDFFLEVSTNGGGSYTIVEEWNSGAEMTNNVRYDVTVNIPGNLLSSTTVIRFRCDASTNSDRVYLDDILIETCGSSLQIEPITKSARPKGNTGSLMVYPNPAQNDLFLELNDIQSNKMVSAKVISSFGQLIREYKLDEHKYSRLNISELQGGQTYLIIIETKDGASFIEKFIKL